MNLFRLKFLRTSVTLRNPSRSEPSRAKLSRAEPSGGDGLSLYHRTQSSWTRLEYNRLAQHGRNIRHGENFLITLI